MWKFKEFAENNGKLENMNIIKSRLEALVGKIPEIKKLEVGININKSPAAFDMTLYSEFENEEALEIYQKHPEHVKVSEFVTRVRDDRAVVDYIA
jgi:hypothetical protein